LDDVDPHDERLTKREGVAIALMIDKREQYVAAGRMDEAHGAGRMLRIAFDALTEKQVANTGWGDL
jgi:hypothetical protein